MKQLTITKRKKCLKINAFLYLTVSITVTKNNQKLNNSVRFDLFLQLNTIQCSLSQKHTFNIEKKLKQITKIIQILLSQLYFFRIFFVNTKFLGLLICNLYYKYSYLINTKRPIAIGKHDRHLISCILHKGLN